MLSILGSIYGKIADLRNGLYDKGVFDSFYLRAYTVSVGNITSGGTGKTPLVAYIVNILAGRGEKVCILTRGYGRENPGQRVLVSDGNEILADARSSGDEPFELANKLLGKAIVIADADRVAAAEWANRMLGVTAFVLDDGFQHRKARRDVDIVCIDATNPFGGGEVLPTGRLREPLWNLERADIIVITRSDLVPDISNLRSEISNLNAKASIFEAENRIADIVTLEEFHAKTLRLQREEKEKAAPHDWSRIRAAAGHSGSEIRIAAFCALGNPDSFFRQLSRAFVEVHAKGFELTITKTFADHHAYSQQDIDSLHKQAKESGIDAFLTTGKDAVKLSNLRFEIPCFVVEIEAEIHDAEAFSEAIEGKRQK